MPAAVRKAANRWRPNSETSACSGCGRPFSLLVRRHHCRQCGDIFCAECSDHRRIVPIVHPTEAQRVCKKCDRYAAEAGGALRNGSIRLSNTSPYPDSGSNPSNNRLSEDNEYAVRKASVISHSQEQIASVSRSVDGNRARGAGFGGSIGHSETRGLLDRNGSIASRSVASPARSPNEGCDRASVSPLAPSLVATAGPSPNAAPNRDAPHHSPHDSPASVPDATQSSQLLTSEGPLEGADVGEDDVDEFGLTGTPPSISPSLKEVVGNGSMSAGAALSFMAALEDATRVRQLTLPVLLYVREGHELPIVVPVENDETVDAMIGRLTPKFFELANVRKKPKPSELEALRKTLSFVNEQGIVIPNDLQCATLSRRGERVVLATAEAILSYKRFGTTNNSGSNRSRHSAFFQRSERSDPGNDAPEFEDD